MHIKREDRDCYVCDCKSDRKPSLCEDKHVIVVADFRDDHKSL